MGSVVVDDLPGTVTDTVNDTVGGVLGTAGVGANTSPSNPSVSVAPAGTGLSITLGAGG